MALHCKNCAGILVFDPEVQKLTCKTCSSSFFPEEIEDTEKELLEDSDRYRESKIYVCNACGAEVEVNDNESSTFCLYCGNPQIVFSRIAKTRCPDKIIPFKITRKQAMDNLIPYLRTAKFLDRDQRYLWLEKIHGIYIPYWTVSGTHYETMQLVIEEDSYTTIKGRVETKDLPVYGSDKLSQDHLDKIGNWDMKGAVPFDEEYLRGYYSDVTDIDFNSIRKKAEDRCFAIFNRKMKMDAEHPTDNICYRNPYFDFNAKPEYVMMPVWFQTVNNRDGTRSTFVMNGQTGECFGSFPALQKKNLISILKNIAIIVGFSLPVTFTMTMISLGTYTSVLPLAYRVIPVCAICLAITGYIYYKALKNNRIYTRASHIATDYSAIRKDD